MAEIIARLVSKLSHVMNHIWLWAVLNIKQFFDLRMIEVKHSKAMLEIHNEFKECGACVSFVRFAITSWMFDVADKNKSDI